MPDQYTEKELFDIIIRKGMREDRDGGDTSDRFDIVVYLYDFDDTVFIEKFIDLDFHGERALMLLLCSYKFRWFKVMRYPSPFTDNAETSGKTG